MPAMAVAFQAVSREAIGHATSAINVTQRLAGSIGTALLAVVLQRSIESELHLAGGLDSIGALGRRERADAGDALAHAFARSFWVALALVALALVPALMLPRLRREPAERPAPKLADAR